MFESFKKLLYFLYNWTSLYNFFIAWNIPYINITVPGCGSVWYLHQKSHVQKVLNSGRLTFVQHTLNKLLTHSETINCFDIDSDRWKQQHILFKGLNVQNQSYIHSNLKKVWCTYYNTRDPVQLKDKL
ncbi:MAG: hypothetical protein Sylvanvirus38_6, partial [Sylvanvirus sp.]